jgi:hypothetical protein
MIRRFWSWLRRDAEIRRLQRIIESLCARTAVASEVIAKNAERRQREEVPR